MAINAAASSNAFWRILLRTIDQSISPGATVGTGFCGVSINVSITLLERLRKMKLTRGQLNYNWDETDTARREFVEKLGWQVWKESQTPQKTSKKGCSLSWFSEHCLMNWQGHSNLENQPGTILIILPTLWVLRLVFLIPLSQPTNAQLHTSSSRRSSGEAGGPSKVSLKTSQYKKSGAA